MTNSKPPVTIIGCGVNGLSSGIRLLQAGFAVNIIARDLPPNTTSNIAAAIWHPYAVYPIERAMAWGRAALDIFYQLYSENCGVSPLTIREVYYHPIIEHWAAGILRHVEPILAPDLPSGYVCGFQMETVLIETPVYMRYLVERFCGAGGQIKQRAINTLADVIAADRIIVNCTGVGARQVADDPHVHPLRGQIVKVHAPAIQHGVLAESADGSPTYIFPRSDGCILGGTAQKDNWSLAVDPATAADIRARCEQIEPTLHDAEVLAQLVGLRPGRHEVRLEVEHIGQRQAVIHNYGHGGAGVTLSWGCAAEVVQLALAVAREWDSLS